jgi:hypothetical protein
MALCHDCKLVEATVDIWCEPCHTQGLQMIREYHNYLEQIFQEMDEEGDAEVREMEANYEEFLNSGQEVKRIEPYPCLDVDTTLGSTVDLYTEIPFSLSESFEPTDPFSEESEG